MNLQGVILDNKIKTDIKNNTKKKRLTVSHCAAGRLKSMISLKLCFVRLQLRSLN